MPKPQPVPRKYKSQINDAKANLKTIAQRAELAREALQTERHSAAHASNILREIETLAYRTALELREVEVATGCDSCPAAPPNTENQALLILIATHLEQLADIARRQGNGAIFSNIDLES